MYQKIKPGSRLPDLYTLDTTHEWNRGMNAITRAILAPWQFPPGPILELGCGGGGLLATLQPDYPRRALIGMDIHPLAVAQSHARFQQSRPAADFGPQSSPLLYQGDMHALPFTDGSIASVLLLDSLDQEGISPVAVLKEAARVLAPGGFILVRVSAVPWLMGPHDTAFNTAKRYAHHELRSLFQTPDYVIRRITYANGLLGIAAVPLRVLRRFRLLETDEHKTVGGSWAGKLLAGALDTESRLLGKGTLPFGLSLYLLAQRTPTPGLPNHGYGLQAHRAKLEQLP